VHLVSCIRPEGALESAPATSLRTAAPGERWEGFWCVADERFYARCTMPEGREQWFRIADIASSAVVTRRRETRVIQFPVRADRRPRMLVGRYRGNAMLVGTQRRRRATPEAR
jgi:hypothetical protein